MLQKEQWQGFEGRLWKEEINVRDFIQNNYTPYEGDSSFLADPTEATNQLWGKLQELQKEERAKGGVLDMETDVVSGITAYGAAYIDDSMKDLEQVVGLQTDKPLKRAFMPFGGIKMAEQACSTYGYEPDPELHKEVFHQISPVLHQIVETVQVSSPGSHQFLPGEVLPPEHGNLPVFQNDSSAQNKMKWNIPLNSDPDTP